MTCIHARIHLSDRRGCRLWVQGSGYLGRITDRHFIEIFERVRGLYEEMTRERHVQRSWQIIYRQDLKKVLKKPGFIITSAKNGRILNDEIRE